MDEVTGIVGSDLFGSAIDRSDDTTALALLEQFKSGTSKDIDRLFVITNCGCPGQVPEVSISYPGADRLGQERPASDYLIPNFAGGGPTGAVSMVTTSQRTFVASHSQGPPTIAVAVRRRPPATFTTAGNVLLADILVSQAATWLGPIAGPDQRIYVFDESYRAIAAVADGNAVAAPLSSSVVDAVRGTDQTAVRLSDGPADTRTLAAASVTSSGWHVVVARPVSAAEIELGNAGAQQRWLRVVLIGFLLIGAALVGWFDQRLRAQGKALALASRHKSDFLANMSHELRTPLNAVIGFSDVLLQSMFGQLNERQTEYVRDIRDAGRHQLALVNDILDLSKVEAGRMELEPTDFSLAALIADAVALLRERASKGGVTLIVTAADAALGTVTADERKIKQVLVNLIVNGIKFTPSGGSVTVDGQRQRSGVSVSVTDTGVGIARADQTRIFEEFQQAGRGAPRASEGTGLGLSLARRFVELHGGTLSVESELGHGARFTFVVPQPVVAAA
jgi:signal transduction histidine kinase